MYDPPPPPLPLLSAPATAGIAAALAWIVVIVLSVPLFLTLATGSALSTAPDRSGALGALTVAGLLFIVAAPLIAAGIAKVLVAGFSGATVGYWRAAGAMFLSFVITVAAAVILPRSAAMPIVGYGWIGAIAGGWLLSRPRRIS
jgi:hypothetical protein